MSFLPGVKIGISVPKEKELVDKIKNTQIAIELEQNKKNKTKDINNTNIIDNLEKQIDHFKRELENIQDPPSTSTTTTINQLIKTDSNGQVIPPATPPVPPNQSTTVPSTTPERVPPPPEQSSTPPKKKNDDKVTISKMDNSKQGNMLNSDRDPPRDRDHNRAYYDNNFRPRPPFPPRPPFGDDDYDYNVRPRPPLPPRPPFGDDYFRTRPSPPPLPQKPLPKPYATVNTPPSRKLYDMPDAIHHLARQKAELDALIAQAIRELQSKGCDKCPPHQKCPTCSPQKMDDISRLMQRIDNLGDQYQKYLEHLIRHVSRPSSKWAFPSPSAALHAITGSVEAHTRLGKRGRRKNDFSLTSIPDADVLDKYIQNMIKGSIMKMQFSNSKRKRKTISKRKTIKRKTIKRKTIKRKTISKRKK